MTKNSMSMRVDTMYTDKTPMVIDFGLAFKINDFIISSGFK